MENFLDLCRPLLEKDMHMLDETSDDIMKLTNSEALRYSLLHQVSILAILITPRGFTYISYLELCCSCSAQDSSHCPFLHRVSDYGGA